MINDKLESYLNFNTLRIYDRLYPKFKENVNMDKVSV